MTPREWTTDLPLKETAFHKLSIYWSQLWGHDQDELEMTQQIVKGLKTHISTPYLYPYWGGQKFRENPYPAYHSLLLSYRALDYFHKHVLTIIFNQICPFHRFSTFRKYRIFCRQGFCCCLFVCLFVFTSGRSQELVTGSLDSLEWTYLVRETRDLPEPT